ncbi:zinc finger BED domain-containing protein 1-like [Pecten maximus]|uniref:zinc finger BED domain-containing protein 1-like n=1 Tax=Pecten maximus TaxID=6579 RepID=UPI001458C9EE|nr:zinc finger BED domain-containing protein 1-like [Pecten maximus]
MADGGFVDDTVAIATSTDTELYDHPGGGKARSKVWDVFAFRKIKKELPSSRKNLDMTVAVCRLCQKSYKNTGNTTNFMSHIRNEHSLPKGTDNTPKVKTNTTTTGTCIHTPTRKPRQVQSTLNFPSQESKLGNERKKALDDRLMKMVIGKVLPTSLVDNCYFKEFVQLLDPRYNLPCRKTLVGWLEKKKVDIQECIKADIKKCEGVAITHDSWTSNATDSYNTNTLHYIDDNWRLNSADLGTIKMEGSHTSENIAKSLQTTKTNWSLPDNIIATTDNAANEQKAFRLLEWSRFGCFGHKLNLVVKNSLQSNNISRLTSKGRRLVTLFHSSTSAHDFLSQKQRQLEIKGAGHRLLNDVPTRWNSTLLMLERLIEQMPALMAVASDENVSKNIRTTLQNTVFSFEETSIADKVMALLTPFLRATEIVCSESNPTINKVIPVVTKLKRKLEISEDDSPLIQSMKKKMLEQLTFRTEVKVKVKPGDAAAMPATSNSATTTNPSLPSMAEFDMKDPDTPTDTVQVDSNVLTQTKIKSPSKKKQKFVDCDETLKDIVCTGETKVDREDTISKEIERYLSSPVNTLSDSDKSLTTLEWWKENELFSPRIAVLAKHYLAVQASSVPSERVFSLAGELVSKKRSRMSPEHVDLFIFLNKNIKFW